MAKTQKPLSEPKLENLKVQECVIKENKTSVRKLLQRLKDEVKYRNVPKDYRKTLKKGLDAIEIDVNKKTKTTYSPDGKVKKQKFNGYTYTIVYRYF